MKTISGNVLEVRSGIICHGVNCCGVMGAGIARQIKEKWPKVYEEYVLQNTGPDMLGCVQFVEVGTKVKDKPPLIIANCWTQVFYGVRKPYKSGLQHLDYKALDECIKKVFKYVAEQKTTVHFPKIGCGLAGGDWPTVKKLIEDNEKKLGITSYYWEYER